MSSGEESNREDELAIVNLENVKRISETYKPKGGKGKKKKGKIPKAVVQEIWKDRLSPRFYSRMMSVMFPEECEEVSFLSFYTIYKNLAEPETEIMFRALTIYHIATIHEPPFNYEQANEYPNASYKAIKDYVCDVITSYLHAIIHFNMKEAHAWLDLRASNTLIDGNLVASYMLKDLETHRNEVSIGSLEIWLEKNEIYYTVSEQLFLFLFGVNRHVSVKPLLPLPVVQTGRATKTLLALPDVLLLNSKLPKRAQRWTLAYMLDSRSQNWETLKKAIHGRGQTIIVIQDANGDIFGMYGSNKWFPAEGFFGNDECFLFTLKPDVNIYEKSGRDNNFQLFTESGIGMGGTAAKLALFIQSDTVKGSTSLACSTFREFWPLARELEFKITQIEIWEADYEAQEVVEQDVGTLIRNTQYMRMKGDEVYNEKRTTEQPKSKQPQDGPDPAIDNTYDMPTMAMCGPLRCCGECAMYAQPKHGPRYNQGRVCCSKRCSKKIKDCGSPCGEGDGSVKVHTAQRYPYPRQEEERRQFHQICTEDKVKVKRDNRRRQISCDARQQHGGAGFIHPSLAAEENERNAREAKAASPPPLVSKSNRFKTSKTHRSSLERDLSQKLTSPTITHNKTQVGESRLMKPTCRTYKTENKCACVVKKTCAFAPIERFLPASGQSEKTCDAYESSTTRDFSAESSSTGLIEINSNSDRKTERVTLMQSNSAVSETTAQGNKSKAPSITEKEKLAKKSDQPTSEASNKNKQMLPNMKSESSSKQIRKERDREVKGKQEETSHSPGSQKKFSTNELDCHCSSSTDCNDVEVGTKKFYPASTCGCEAKVSNYLTKTNRIDITGVPLSDISSSVCSCILDNKNKITATSAGISVSSSKKETQNLTQSRRKSNGSSRSMPTRYIITKNSANSKSICTECPNSSLVFNKETQLLTKTRRVSRESTFSSGHFNERPQTIPPTCLRCKTLVGQHGCQCKAKSISNKVTPTTLQTSHLVQKELSKNTFALKNGGSRRSVVIDTDAMSFISEGSKAEPDGGSLSASTSSSSRNINRASSQSSQIKQDQKKPCKTSCNCSLSRSYFPIFPEDLIKEDKTMEDCDCASYNNLRFPIIVETPPELSPEPSIELRTTKAEPDEAHEKEEEEAIKNKQCGCEDNDNTIIILNVSKCNTAETVQKIIQDLEEKTGDASNPNFKSLVFNCKEFSEPGPSTLQYSTCTSKGGLERKVLRQQIEKILKKKGHGTQPELEKE